MLERVSTHSYAQYQGYTPFPTFQVGPTSDLEETILVQLCSSDNMPSPLLRFQPDASSRSRVALPSLLFVASLIANVGTPSKHSLLTSALAWLLTCVLSSLKTGAKSLLDVTPSKKAAWAAGALFALAQVCDKAVEGRAIWWAKVT